MDHRMDLENHKTLFNIVKGKDRAGVRNMEEFGMEEEFHIPKKKENPSIRERHDQFFEKE
ncbi:hypothetical protein NST62_08465 [Ureibacillus sp. FSL K6-8385]|uniref:Uncharacterized protein n=1 Tax=Ureibacillus terrenus TaxID=118246 RepID=A0A540V1K1_9BACL|nr:hypothetical protein [Ureibacillus terrenus]MED3661988.1 hypothetical protein [Ureibacillus terrenus]MED3764749.1 hypothetical protein [Ureibacillus terrenus]TQE90615.1 hypothetical protein FKZ59_08905 [Ureibacillus terrenus]